MISKFSLLGACVAALYSSLAQAVPIYFLNLAPGNHADIDWMRMESKHFSAYYDKRAPHVARFALTSAETAYPYLSSLLGVRLKNDGLTIGEKKSYITSSFERVPLIISTQTDAAAFSDFLTYSVELPIASGSKGSLFEHELVHRLMYEHIDLNLGPGGRAYSLAIMPTWWVEGLAEFLTESIGRLETAGISRSMSVNDRYVSWDRLHSLYNASGNQWRRGYVISGQFLKFLHEKSKSKDLYQFHRQWLYKLLTPPFINAPNSVLQKELSKDGYDLFLEFKDAEKKKWQAKTGTLPTLSAASSEDFAYYQDFPSTLTVVDKKILYSWMAVAPFPSALNLNSLDGKSRKRIEINSEGSSLFSIEKNTTTESALWTKKVARLDNGTYSDELVYLKFDSGLRDVKAEKIKGNHVVNFPEKSVQLSSLQSVGTGKVFALGTLRAQTHLYFADAHAKTAKLVKSWDIPVEVKMVERARSLNASPEQSCTALLVDHDKEVTELVEVCEDGSVAVIMPPRKLYIKHAMQLNDGKFVVSVGWDDFVGLGYVEKGAFTAIAALPEWIEGLLPWGESQTHVGVWKHVGSGVKLEKISLTALGENFQKYLSGGNVKPHFSAVPAWSEPIPPYKKLYAQSKTVEAKESFQPPAESTFTNEEATYRSRHFFTYPLVVPPAFGGWSLGFASIPLMDEMERYLIQTVGYYNSYTDNYSIDLDYIDRRLFSGFTVGAFLRDRFNGIYYSEAKKASYYSYLRETGLDSNAYFKLHRRLSLNVKLSGTQLKPSSDRPQASIGTQSGLLAGASTNLSVAIFEKAFYVSDTGSFSDDHLVWSTAGSVGGGQYQSIGRTENNLGDKTAPLNFQKVSANLATSFGFRGYNLALRSNISGTLGKNTLKLKEIYQPYQTYLLGSGSGLNAQNFAIAGSTAIFSRLAGYWAFRNSAALTFPVVREIDKQFFIAYFDSIDGELVYAKGGISYDEKLKRLEVLTSVSAALRATIDIKGFQVFPSVAFGRIVDRDAGWSLFSEISFTNFF